jgi:hypothetical protein
MNAINARAGVAERWSKLPEEWLNIIDRDRARADGFTEEEIDQMEAYCREKERLEWYDRRPELVELPAHGIAFVCRTVAEAIERLRPGWWLSRPKD